MGMRHISHLQSSAYIYPTLYPTSDKSHRAIFFHFSLFPSSPIQISSTEVKHLEASAGKVMITAGQKTREIFYVMLGTM